jgi:hypothetical protein
MKGDAQFFIFSVSGAGSFERGEDEHGPFIFSGGFRHPRLNDV